MAILLAMNTRLAQMIPALLNQSQSGIYIDTGLGSTANTVFPANAGIQGTVQNVLSWTPAYAGVTKGFAPPGFAN